MDVHSRNGNQRIEIKQKIKFRGRENAYPAHPVSDDVPPLAPGMPVFGDSSGLWISPPGTE
jgi:hypothetical protein